MGCSNSGASDPRIKPLGDDTGADENQAAPSHGANELPPEPYEPEFPADHYIAWIIDDAVARTKPLPKWKKAVDLPDNQMSAAMDYSMSDEDAGVTDRSERTQQPTLQPSQNRRSTQSFQSSRIRFQIATRRHAG